MGLPPHRGKLETWVLRKALEENTKTLSKAECPRPGVQGWVPKAVWPRLGAQGQVSKPGCLSLCVQGWVGQPGCPRLGVQDQVSKPVCPRLGAQSPRHLPGTIVGAPGPRGEDVGLNKTQTWPTFVESVTVNSDI